MEHLPYLRILLQNLPAETNLPLVAQSESTIYKFTNFSPVQQYVQVDGTEQPELLSKAYLREIEEAMHMRGSDPIFFERGPDIVGVVDVLEQYLQLFPSDNDVEYIIDELLATAKGYYHDSGKSVSVIGPALFVYVDHPDCL
jgi:hypothetical protein